MSRQEVDIVNKKPEATDARSVFELVHAVMHLFRAEQYRAYRDGPYELTHMEGRLLGFLARNDGAKLAELVTYMERDKGQLAKLVKNLREQGLIAGQDDEKDRRSVRLTLTAKGREIHTSLRRQVNKLAEQSVQGMNASEKRRLVELLQRMRENLGPDTETPRPAASA
jgi:DNA-binding MarR family transcriptional regulator